MIRFGTKYFAVENALALAGDMSDFGLAFRRICKLKFQEDCYLFLEAVARRAPPQSIYMQYIIPVRAPARTDADRAAELAYEGYDGTRYFPQGHRPNANMLVVTNRVRVNVGRNLNISAAARQPMIDLANRNIWAEAMWRGLLNTAAGEINRLLVSNNTMSDLYESAEFLRLVERHMMPCVQQSHADTFVLTARLPNALKSDRRLVEFVRYAKTAVLFDELESRHSDVFERAAQEMLRALREDHGITATFDDLKQDAWRA